MRTFTGATNCDDKAKKGNNKGKIMVNLLENCRDPEEINRLNQQYIANGKPPKYDISKASMNIYYETCRTTEEAFESVFGESMERYNAGQKRNDRKTSMEKELAKLDKGRVKQELIHCMVVQVGNHDDHPPEEECVEILQKYLAEFRQRYSNMRIISCAIHLDEQDEGTPHLQFYYIPVKTREQHIANGNTKRWSGMDVQPSLTGALLQMGYNNDATVLAPKMDENGEPVLDDNGNPVMEEKHDYDNGAMEQWRKDFNGLLDEICMEHDIVLDHYMRGKKVTHQDTRDYYDGKINQQVMQAMRTRDAAEAESSQAIFDAENAREEAAKLQKANEALERRAEQAEQRAEAAEQREAKAVRRAEAAERREQDAEKTVEEYEQRAQKKSVRQADEYIAYYKRSRVQIEKDPQVYEAFAHARKLTKRTQNAWQKYRTCITRSGRRRWAAKAMQLQERTNEAWQEAKEYAALSKQEAALRRQKAEIRKEIDELLKPHIADFKNFCTIYNTLSAEKQAKYRAQFEETRKRNKADIKDMSRHLTRIFGSKQTLEYDKIRDVQEDRRQMNKLANRMLKDAKQESGGDAKDLFDMLKNYDAEQAAKDQAAKREDAITAMMKQSSDYDLEPDDDYGLGLD